MILAIRGPNKTCKTTLGLTFPKPLMHFDLDLGFDRAAPRFKEDIDTGLIVSKRYPAPLKVAISDKGEVTLRFSERKVVGVRELWEEFTQDFIEALVGPQFKTLMIDTGTVLWEITHRAFLQEKQEAQKPEDINKQGLRERLLPVEYGEPNSRMRAVFHGCRTYEKNLVLTHFEREKIQEKLTDRGVVEERTGIFELDGFKHTGDIVDIQVATYLNKNVPHCKVELCGLAIAFQGAELEEPSYDKIVNGLAMLRGEQDAGTDKES